MDMAATFGNEVTPLRYFADKVIDPSSAQPVVAAQETQLFTAVETGEENEEGKSCALCIYDKTEEEGCSGLGETACCAKRCAWIPDTKTCHSGFYAQCEVRFCHMTETQGSKKEVEYCAMFPSGTTWDKIYEDLDNHDCNRRRTPIVKMVHSDPSNWPKLCDYAEECVSQGFPMMLDLSCSEGSKISDIYKKLEEIRKKAVAEGKCYDVIIVANQCDTFIGQGILIDAVLFRICPDAVAVDVDKCGAGEVCAAKYGPNDGAVKYCRDTNGAVVCAKCNGPDSKSKNILTWTILPELKECINAHGSVPFTTITPTKTPTATPSASATPTKAMPTQTAGPIYVKTASPSTTSSMSMQTASSTPVYVIMPAASSTPQSRTAGTSSMFPVVTATKGLY